MGAKLKLTGQRFGFLTVLEETQERKRGLVVWKCQCDCGKIVKVTGTDLKTGNTKSCGCKKYDGLINYNLKNSEEAKIPIGTKFGYLEVLKDLGIKEYYHTGHGRRYYSCLCTRCGKRVEYTQNALKSGDRVSCGCVGSRGEEQIKEILSKNGIKYVFDHGLPGIQKETGYKLRFDFIIYQNEEVLRCIEFDGRQHQDGFECGLWFKMEPLSLIQNRDIKKNEYCKKHNIPLVRIPYTHLNKITLEDLMGEKFLI